MSSPIPILRDIDRPGAHHMAADLALLTGNGPVLRLYTWLPWAVSLGHHQSDTHLDRSAVDQQGWDVVRRPTGGRAVLHAEELTYAIAVPIVAGMTPTGVYESVHHMLLAALAPFSPALSFAPRTANLHHHYATSGASAMSCFTSSARTEIQHEGRKVVGSAQRRIGSWLLQHGSILTGPAHGRIVDVLAVDAAERRSVADELTRSSVSLSEIAGRVVTPADVADAIESIVHTSAWAIDSPATS